MPPLVRIPQALLIRHMPRLSLRPAGPSINQHTLAEVPLWAKHRTDRKNTIPGPEEHRLYRAIDVEAGRPTGAIGDVVLGTSEDREERGAHSTVVKTGLWVLILLHHLLTKGPWASHSVFRGVSFLIGNMETELKSI